jgi:hypothetical protein
LRVFENRELEEMLGPEGESAKRGRKNYVTINFVLINARIRVLLIQITIHRTIVWAPVFTGVKSG